MTTESLLRLDINSGVLVNRGGWSGEADYGLVETAILKESSTQTESGGNETACVLRELISRTPPVLLGYDGRD